jgi:hypothetical protein
MNAFTHDNLNTFIGLCVNGPVYMSIWKFCARQSLKEVIEKSTLNLDFFFKLSLIKDIVEVSCLGRQEAGERAGNGELVMHTQYA